MSTHPTLNRPIVVPDETGLAQGWEIGSVYPLSTSLEPSMTRGFAEIYFRTESGNLYGIKRSKDGGWVVGNSNTGTVSVLTRRDLDQGILEIGTPFTYGNNATTSKVTEIVALSGSYYGGTPNLGALREVAITQTSGRVSFIKEEFVERFRMASKPSAV